ncbi:para-nitrobenzyl esterase [Pseudonocardia ammonioxydans]|uniref:Carboxylic ester hydrolase n=1 Tax=Pseudonocardia ammonioxydans TaxID=260086 RepID=A0A1I4XHC8_PSUAM|nr:carboxylesterase family protein [Pseudonocardia ammonioxydans]SFN24699.1 para-nitrobenzyl esterase [Pseudonocardia ammonioxydans]
MNESLVRTTAPGAVRGEHVDGVEVYRGVPYAASPVGELRFAPPVRHPGWAGVRDCRSPGPAVPQPPSRLEAVMGPTPTVFDEDDSLNLNVYAPAEPGPHPVLLWIHGGGFSSGSGGWPWYDGTRLARAERIVVVTINYRLGPLGFMALPGTGPQTWNIGVRDQVAALQWVVANVAGFGGDPARITVGGQSAGAASAAALTASPAGRHIRGAILESPPNSTLFATPQAAFDTARRVLDRVGIDADQPFPALREAPVSALLAATGEIARADARVGTVDPVFRPVVDPELGIVDRVGGGLADVGDNPVPLLVGTTRDEMAAFLRPAGAAVTEEQVREWFVAGLGPGGADAYRAAREASPDLLPAELLERESTGRAFLAETVVIARSRAASRAPTWVYRFDWSPDSGGFGACHCVELPFVFDTGDAFAAAPMLGGESIPRDLVRVFRSAIGSFVRDSVVRDGAAGAMPSWPEFGTDQNVLHLGNAPVVRGLDDTGVAAWSSGH